MEEEGEFGDYNAVSRSPASLEPVLCMLRRSIYRQRSLPWAIPDPPKEPIFVLTPNHDRVVDDNFVTTGQIWWEVRPGFT